MAVGLSTTIPPKRDNEFIGGDRKYGLLQSDRMSEELRVNCTGGAIVGGLVRGLFVCFQEIRPIRAEPVWSFPATRLARGKDSSRPPRNTRRASFPAIRPRRRRLWLPRPARTSTRRSSSRTSRRSLRRAPEARRHRLPRGHVRQVKPHRLARQGAKRSGQYVFERKERAS